MHKSPRVTHIVSWIPVIEPRAKDKVISILFYHGRRLVVVSEPVNQLVYLKIVFSQAPDPEVIVPLTNASALVIKVKTTVTHIFS